MDEHDELLPISRSEGDIFINRPIERRPGHDMFAGTSSAQINGLFESASDVFWKPKRYALNARPTPVQLLSKAGGVGGRAKGARPAGHPRSSTSLGFSNDHEQGSLPQLRSKSTEPNAQEQKHGEGDGAQKGGAKKYTSLPLVRPSKEKPMGKSERELQKKLDVFRSDPRRMADLQERIAKHMVILKQNEEKKDESHILENRKHAWDWSPAARAAAIQHAADEREKKVEAARERFEQRQRELEEWRVYQANRDSVRKAQEDAKRNAQKAKELKRMRTLAWLQLMVLGSRLGECSQLIIDQRRLAEELQEQSAAARTIQKHFKRKQRQNENEQLEEAAVKIQRHFRHKVMARLGERRVAAAERLLRFLRDAGDADRTVMAFRTFRLKVVKAQRMVKMYIMSIRAQSAMVVKQWDRQEGALVARREGKTRGKGKGKKGADTNISRSNTTTSKSASRKAEKDASDFTSMDVILFASDSLRKVPADIKFAVADAFQRQKRRAYQVAMARYRKQTVEWEQYWESQAALEAARNIVQGTVTDDTEKKEGGPRRPTFRSLANPEQVRVLMMEGVKETYRLRTLYKDLAQGPMLLDDKQKMEVARSAEHSLKKNPVIKEMLDELKAIKGGVIKKAA